MDDEVAALAAQIESIKVEKKLSKSQKSKLKQKAKQEAAAAAGTPAKE